MSRFIRSASFALNGIMQCFIRERHFKVHSIFTIVVIAGGFTLNISNTEWLIVLINIAIVIAAELINTAIEQLCDIVHIQQHPGIKLVKDMAAGAVLVVAISAMIAAAIIFIPKVILILQQ